MAGPVDRPPLRLALIGLGLIGGSIGLAARERLGAHVVGWDPDPEAVSGALAAGAIDEAAESIAALAALDPLDIVLVAAPVDVLLSAVSAALDACPNALVTDVGSTKGELTQAGLGPRYIGGHPLAGAEVAGIAHARADLTDGATWYLTPQPDAQGVLLERLHRFVTGIGAVPTVIDAAAHDRLMAAFSHLPHVVANVLVTHARQALGGNAWPVVGPSFRDASRVAGANPALWGGIYAANADAILTALDGAMASLAGVRALIAAGDVAALTTWQAAAAGDRSALLDLAGASGPLQELRVIVPNRPGVIAELALSLAHAGINIQDMSLRPKPDDRSGEVVLWVAREQAEQARALVDAAASAGEAESG